MPENEIDALCLCLEGTGRCTAVIKFAVFGTDGVSGTENDYICVYAIRSGHARRKANGGDSRVPNMKIIIASDSFKGSLSSLEAGNAAAGGIKSVLPSADVEVIPVADGGEGTVEAVVRGLGGKTVSVTVTGPSGSPAEAVYGLCGGTAVIEMASASGLLLVPEGCRDPWSATSYGTGELIRDALLRGCRRILAGIGGSATNDGGIGMLRALGYRFLDRNGMETGFGGGDAAEVREIDASGVLPELKEAEFIVACDVSNPLTGPNGASRVFGPQKGAGPAMAEALDAGLASFARLVAGTTGEDLSDFPGAGAAGGLGFAFLAFLGARLGSGIGMVLDAVGFDRRIEDASLVITGEGRLDRQTCMGKAPYGVLQRSKAKGIPVAAIGGTVDPDAVSVLRAAGFSAVIPVTEASMDLHEAMRPEVAARNIARAMGLVLRESGLV